MKETLKSIQARGADSLRDIDALHMLVALRNEYLGAAKDLVSKPGNPEDSYFGENLCEVAEKIQEAIEVLYPTQEIFEESCTE